MAYLELNKNGLPCLFDILPEPYFGHFSTIQWVLGSLFSSIYTGCFKSLCPFFEHRKELLSKLSGL